MRRLFLIVPILATIALFAALVPAAGTAQEDPPVYWESIDVITDVQENGDMLVTETQTYQFTRPHTTQRYRYIPLGLVESIDAVSVWQDGEKISGVHSGIEDGQQWIRWSHRPLDPPETLTFVLRYRVRDGLRLDADGGQVYWKALFKDRDTDIRTGSVTVRLPESLSGRIEDYRSFGSSAGSRQVDPRTVVFRTSGPLPPGKELEVQVTFPHGLLDVPTPEWQQRHFWEREVFWAWAGRVMFIVLVFLLALALSRSFRAWPRVSYPELAGPVTQPPSDLSAAAVSVLESREVTPRTLLAIMVEMCRKGVLQIAVVDDGDLPSRNWKGDYYYWLSRHRHPQFEWERLLFDAIPDRPVKANDLPGLLRRNSDSIGDYLDEYLWSRGIFDGDPIQTHRKYRRRWFRALLRAMTVMAGIGFALWLGLWLPPWENLSKTVIWGIPFGLTADVALYRRLPRILASGSVPPTETGAYEISRWRELRKFLRSLTPSGLATLPDSLLPYAIALHTKQEWVSAHRDSPLWANASWSTHGAGPEHVAAYSSFLLAGGWRNQWRERGFAGFGGGGGDGGGG